MQTGEKPMVQRIRIEHNRFYDSIVLMNATKCLQAKEGIVDALIVMGTESNGEILREMGFSGSEADSAGPNDLIIACKAADEKIWDELNFDSLFSQSPSGAAAACGISGGEPVYPDLAAVLQAHPEVNTAVISIDERFAAFEAEKTLSAGLSTILFSSGIPTGEERKLKEKAFHRQVLLMGPDCGVCNLHGKAYVLASMTDTGPVGLIGPSGSGLQELSAILSSRGVGVSQVIGSGGYDLHPDVGGITTKSGIAYLERDPGTGIIILFYKKSTDQIRNELGNLLENCSKPVLVCSFGEDPAYWQSRNIPAYQTMDETARAAVHLLHAGRSSAPDGVLTPFSNPDHEILKLIQRIRSSGEITDRYLKGVFGAGTFSAQLQSIFSQAGLTIASNRPFGGGTALDRESRIGHVCIDVGAEEFTSGRAHPVIDPLPYRLQIQRFFHDGDTGILLADVILGPACHENPAQYLADAVISARTSTGRTIPCIASICGTELDPQSLHRQREILEQAGFTVFETSAQAARFCALLFTPDPQTLLKEWHFPLPDTTQTDSRKAGELIGEYDRAGLPPACTVVNIGSDHMGRALAAQGVPVFTVSKNQGNSQRQVGF